MEDGIAFIFLFVLLILSIFFSACETAYSSLNRIRLKHMASKGSRRAALALTLHEDFNRLLSTLLVGNNIANLSAAAICAVLFVRRFGDIGATLSTVVLTIVVVVFADVTPKVLAKESPEKVAQFCAPFLRVFMFVLAPVNFFFVYWKKLLSLIFKSGESEKSITEEELLSLVEEAEQVGAIDNEDKELLRNALDFYDQQARDILTPRMDVIGVSKTATADEIAEKFLSSGHSRLPIFEESLDRIIGILHMRDFFSYTTGREDFVMTPPVYVAPQTNISDLFKLLQKEKGHMAIVSDEYGGTEGIVTMEDILEELVGEIWDESDKIVEKFVPLENGVHQVLCTASMDDLYDYLNIPQKNQENESGAVSGWIVDMLGKIPEEGDTFTHENLTVTVHKTQHRRALECIIKVNQPERDLPCPVRG
ncbi:MAG: hemolysin family protein [Defluviitaleaceae bacterium]|nr:hemolysin family protein [Defluviitaleaceae bacterium]